jgi:hypothetical protein
MVNLDISMVRKSIQSKKIEFIYQYNTYNILMNYLIVLSLFQVVSCLTTTITYHSPHQLTFFNKPVQLEVLNFDTNYIQIKYQNYELIEYQGQLSITKNNEHFINGKTKKSCDIFGNIKCSQNNNVYLCENDNNIVGSLTISSRNSYKIENSDDTKMTSLILIYKSYIQTFPYFDSLKRNSSYEVLLHPDENLIRLNNHYYNKDYQSTDVTIMTNLQLKYHFSKSQANDCIFVRDDFNDKYPHFFIKEQNGEYQMKDYNYLICDVDLHTNYFHVKNYRFGSNVCEQVFSEYFQKKMKL